MRRLILYFLLSLGCAFAPCLNVASAASNVSETSTPPLDGDDYQSYLEKVAKAERDAAEVLKALDYPNLESFQELADAGAANIELSLRFIREREGKAGIVMYSMYKLDVDGYDAFVRKLVELHHKGLLSDTTLSEGVRPRFSNLVIEQYRNPKIKALLEEMAARDDIPPDIKEQIRYIRSGEGFAERRKRDFDRQCMRWSEMRSIASCVSLATQVLWVYAGSRMTW